MYAHADAVPPVQQHMILCRTHCQHSKHPTPRKSGQEIYPVARMASVHKGRTLSKGNVGSLTVRQWKRAGSEWRVFIDATSCRDEVPGWQFIVALQIKTRVDSLKVSTLPLGYPVNTRIRWRLSWTGTTFYEQAKRFLSSSRYRKYR